MSATETRKLTADINAARDPAEKFTREQNRLTEALNKGAISEATYNRLLDSKAEKYGMVSDSAINYQSALGPIAAVLGTVTVATTAAVAAGVVFVSHLKDVQGQIDSVADAAGKLGVSYDELTGIRFAAQEAGGVDAGTVDASIKKMQINIAKAIEGDTKINEAFNKLGVSAGQLMQAGPVEAVKLIADGMQGVNSQADMLKLSMDVFGKSGTELVSTLTGGRDAIGESVDFMNQWNGLSDEQVAAVQASNDAWDRIGIIVSGMSTTLAAEFAPVFLTVAEEVLGIADGIGGIDEMMRMIVNTTVAYAGQLKDIGELIAWMHGMGDQEKAFDFSSGDKAILAIDAKREEIAKSAEDAKAERELKRQAMLAEDKANLETESEKKVADKAWSDMIDRVLAEEQKRIDMENRVASTALKNAEAYFAKERANQMKLRDDISKGPQSIEAGSSEAAKFFADQINAAIGKEVAPDQGAPTEEQLLTEAQKQSETQAKIEAKQAEQVELLKKILEKKPEVARLR